MAKDRKKLIYVTEPPAGLFYIPAFLSREEETEILKYVVEQPFEPYNHHGYKANREVVYYGNEGGYAGGLTEEEGAKAEAMPSWMVPLRNRFANLMDLAPEEIVMGLVARYTPDAGIGWHRDRPQFGPTVMGVSLESDAEMRFRRYLEDKEEMFKINLEHGSAYLMSGPSRSVWQHGMNPVKELRYSITFRTLRDKKKDATDPRHNPDRIAERLASMNVRYAALTAAAARVEDSPTQLKIAL